MADPRRTKKSRLARELPVNAGGASSVSADTAADGPRDAASEEESERFLARVFAVVVPVAGIALALVMGALAGLAPAILVLAGTALLATIGFFWASLRTLCGDAPLPEGVASHSIMARTPAPERKRETLRALKDLEFEHSIGKIDDADYAELSTRYRAVAKTLMREMDEGLAPRREEAERLVEAYLEKRKLLPARKAVDGPPASEAADGAAPESRPTSRLTCAKCGVSNEPDATFCKKCGSPLSQAPAEEKSSASV